MYCPATNEETACIAFENVCNGFVDCADQSDECFCQDSYKLQCHNIPQIQQICIPPKQYCLNQEKIRELGCSNHPTDINCTEMVEEHLNSEDNHPLYNCLHDFAERFYHMDMSAEELCKTKCTKLDELSMWDSFCKYVGFFSTGIVSYFAFECDHNATMSSEFYRLSKLCDGRVHCKNKADEIDCPGRFYCLKNETLSWINQSNVCDRRKDCRNGKDECSGCIMDGLASTKFLVS